MQAVSKGDPQRRLELPRRSNYEPAFPSERFIVPLLRAEIESVLASLPHVDGAGARALDVGCGRQPFREAIERLGYGYEGLDVDQNTDGTVDHVAPIDGELPASITSQGPFDFVLCTEVLEHVADWQQAFRNLSSLTAPGAHLLITCPCFYMLHEEPYDFWRPTSHALQYFSTRYGFDAVRISRVGTPTDVLGTLLASTSVGPCSSKLIHRAAARVTDKIRGYLARAMERPWLRSAISLNGKFYLSNVALLKRQQA